MNPIEDFRYREQQAFLNDLAARHGFVAFRPDYHGKPRDCYTVLLYTAEDEKHNRQVDRQPTSYSRSEAADRLKYSAVKIPNEYVYRDPFFSFQNTDVNGMQNTCFANHGIIDLRGSNWRDRLEGAVMLAFTRKKHLSYVAGSGGFLEIRESDQTNNDYNREQLRYFRMMHGQAFLGNINYYDQKQDRIVNGEESIYTEFSGQDVFNFEFSFAVPCRDHELEQLVRQWNAGTSCSVDAVMQITDRIDKLGGIHMIWY